MDPVTVVYGEDMQLIARRIMAGLLLLVAVDARCAAPAEDCQHDLAELPGFMLENDAGGQDLQQRYGSAHFATALATAQVEAASVQADDDCLPVLRKYLGAWRRTHLAVAPISPEPSRTTAGVASGNDDRLPTLRLLSGKTLLLTLRSFDDRTRDPLDRLLQSRKNAFESHPDWIIDVRDNDGGKDANYAPLLPWLMVNGGAAVSTRVLVTPANIAGWARVCERMPGHADCAKVVAPIVERMKAARPGDTVPLHEGLEVRSYAADKPTMRRPQRVAILVDEGCGSSCEQFLLDARQSFSVKLVGRHTWGGLDYSNLLAHGLPSGKRRLSYATTRSLRIPDLPVDGLGVLPDIALPRGAGDGAAQQEIERVRRWIEGGTLAP